MIRIASVKRVGRSDCLRFLSRPKPVLAFWICFAALDLLLFLPLFVLNLDTTSVLPDVVSSHADISAIIASLLLFRENADVFRLNLEFSLFVALWLTVPTLRRQPVRVLFTLLYLLTLAYYIYESISLSIFFDEPAVYSHYFFFKDGGKFLTEHLQLSSGFYVVVAAAIVVATMIISSLVGTMLEVPRTGRLTSSSYAAVLALAAVALLAAFSYGSDLANPQLVVSSVSFKIKRNIETSLDLYQDITSYDDTAIRAAYDYSHLALTQKPDIYLIFVESYGSVLYKRPDFRAEYEDIADRLDFRLREAGWHSATALSESTTWGGGSWLAYTSALFGLRIDSHPQYLALLNMYRNAGHPYPGLGRYLKSQGYDFTWISSIATELDDRAWDDYVNFYGVDQWLRLRDLDYSGQQYGWGPAPPDQYVLNFAREKIDAASEQPVLMFFITQNSHFPWVVPELVDDWRQLNVVQSAEPSQPSVESVSHKALRQNYLGAIEYELTLLTDFVTEHDADDAIFVFIGDHQPPRVSRRSDGLSTPIHIVSRDREFIRAFEERGFDTGLTVGALNPTMRHEGFYSLFVGILSERYGSDPATVPDYLPAGMAAGRQTMEGSD